MSPRFVANVLLTFEEVQHLWQSWVEIEHYSIVYFEHGNAVKMRNRIMLDSYPGLPHSLPHSLDLDKLEHPDDAGKIT